MGMADPGVQAIFDNEAKGFTLRGAVDGDPVPFFDDIQSMFEETRLVTNLVVAGGPSVYDVDENLIHFDVRCADKYESMTRRSYRQILLEMKLMAMYSKNSFEAIPEMGEWRGEHDRVRATYFSLAHHLRKDFTKIKINPDYSAPDDPVYIYFYWQSDNPYQIDGNLSKYIELVDGLKDPRGTLHVHKLHIDAIRGHETSFFNALNRQNQRVAQTRNAIGRMKAIESRDFVELFLLMPNNLFVGGFPEQASHFLLEQQRVCQQERHLPPLEKPELLAAMGYYPDQLRRYGRLPADKIKAISGGEIDLDARENDINTGKILTNIHDLFLLCVVIKLGFTLFRALFNPAPEAQQQQRRPRPN